MILQSGRRRDFYLTTFKCWGEGDNDGETSHVVLYTVGEDTLVMVYTNSKFDVMEPGK